VHKILQAVELLLVPLLTSLVTIFLPITPTLVLVVSSSLSQTVCLLKKLVLLLPLVSAFAQKSMLFTLLVSDLVQTPMSWSRSLVLMTMFLPHKTSMIFLLLTSLVSSALVTMVLMVLTVKMVLMVLMAKLVCLVMMALMDLQVLVVQLVAMVFLVKTVLAVTQVEMVLLALLVALVKMVLRVVVVLRVTEVMMVALVLVVQQAMKVSKDNAVCKDARVVLVLAVLLVLVVHPVTRVTRVSRVQRAELVSRVQRASLGSMVFLVATVLTVPMVLLVMTVLTVLLVIGVFLVVILLDLAVALVTKVISVTRVHEVWMVLLVIVVLRVAVWISLLRLHSSPLSTNGFPHLTNTRLMLLMFVLALLLVPKNSTTRSLLSNSWSVKTSLTSPSGSHLNMMVESQISNATKVISITKLLVIKQTSATDTPLCTMKLRTSSV
jgi:20S proteasome subunit beta 7